MNTPRWWHWCFAWLAGFGLFTAVAHGNLETTDAGFTMQAASNLWRRGDSAILLPEQGGERIAEQVGARYIHGLRTAGKVNAEGVAYTWFPIGHVWLLLPVVAVGDALTQRHPAVDLRFRDRVAPGEDAAQLAVNTAWLQGTPVLTQGLIALLVPAAFGATTLLLLFLLARQLGGDGSTAAWTALAIGLGTQMFAFGRETLSDGPGLSLLLAALLAVVAVHHRRGSLRGLLAGGFAAGAAVLLRYQNAALVAVLFAWLVASCHQQRRWRELFAFVLGGLPATVALLGVNYARFGDAFDTGYPSAADWLDQPVWLGASKILFGAGRGVAWLSPLVWLALPLACGRSAGRLRWLGWLLFLFPLGFFALARGWQGGQCWGARYVTHGLTALLVLTLPRTQPWLRWPRTWCGLVLLGVLVNVTSVVAPVRGVIQLATQAVAARGDAGDAADLTGWQPRYSPLWANWRYAAASLGGDFELPDGRPRHGSAHTIEALFGVVGSRPEHGLAPIRWEDRAGRHLWWRFWGDLLQLPAGWLVLPCLLSCALGALACRRLWHLPAPPSPTSTST